MIRKLAERLIGLDARPVERITALLHAITRQAPGGLIQQAIAAIENALVDVKARALGVPVAELLNGPVRERLRLYWSHCGSYRLDHAATMGTAPLRSLDDVRALGREVRERGFTALKTNIFRFDQRAPSMYQPGFARNDGWPELNVDRRLLGTIADQMAAFREGAGPEVDLLLDLNFNFKTEGYIEVAKAIAPYRADVARDRQLRPEGAGADPAAGGDADRVLRIAVRPPPVPPVPRRPGGRRRDRRRALERHPRRASRSPRWPSAYEVNCAPHNFYGNLSTMMSAHFCAAIPNFRIMEIDIDDVPWKDEVVGPPLIEDGHLVLTERRAGGSR